MTFLLLKQSCRTSLFQSECGACLSGEMYSGAKSFRSSRPSIASVISATSFFCSSFGLTNWSTDCRWSNLPVRIINNLNMIIKLNHFFLEPLYFFRTNVCWLCTLIIYRSIFFVFRVGFRESWMKGSYGVDWYTILISVWCDRTERKDNEQACFPVIDFLELFRWRNIGRFRLAWLTDWSRASTAVSDQVVHRISAQASKTEWRTQTKHDSLFDGRNPIIEVVFRRRWESDDRTFRPQISVDHFSIWVDFHILVVLKISRILG